MLIGAKLKQTIDNAEYLLGVSVGMASFQTLGAIVSLAAQVAASDGPQLKPESLNDAATTNRTAQVVLPAQDFRADYVEFITAGKTPVAEQQTSVQTRASIAKEVQGLISSPEKVLELTKSLSLFSPERRAAYISEILQRPHISKEIVEGVRQALAQEYDLSTLKTYRELFSKLESPFAREVVLEHIVRNSNTLGLKFAISTMIHDPCVQVQEEALKLIVKNHHKGVISAELEDAIPRIRDPQISIYAGYALDFIEKKPDGSALFHALKRMSPAQQRETLNALTPEQKVEFEAVAIALSQRGEKVKSDAPVTALSTTEAVLVNRPTLQDIPKDAKPYEVRDSIAKNFSKYTTEDQLKVLDRATDPAQSMLTRSLLHNLVISQFAQLDPEQQRALIPQLKSEHVTSRYFAQEVVLASKRLGIPVPACVSEEVTTTLLSTLKDEYTKAIATHGYLPSLQTKSVRDFAAIDPDQVQKDALKFLAQGKTETFAALVLAGNSEPLYRKLIETISSPPKSEDRISVFQVVSENYEKSAAVRALLNKTIMTLAESAQATTYSKDVARCLTDDTLHIVNPLRVEPENLRKILADKDSSGAGDPRLVVKIIAPASDYNGAFASLNQLLSAYRQCLDSNGNPIFKFDYNESAGLVDNKQYGRPVPGLLSLIEESKGKPKADFGILAGHGQQFSIDLGSSAHQDYRINIADLPKLAQAGFGNMFNSGCRFFIYACSAGKGGSEMLSDNMGDAVREHLLPHAKQGGIMSFTLPTNIKEAKPQVNSCGGIQIELRPWNGSIYLSQNNSLDSERSQGAKI